MTNNTVGSLVFSDKGKYITVIGDGFAVSGTLTFIEHGDDTVENRGLMEPVGQSISVRQWTSVQVGPAYVSEIDSSTPVVVVK